MAIKLITKSGAISLTTGGVPQSEINKLLETQEQRIEEKYADQIEGLNTEIDTLETTNKELNAENDSLEIQVVTLSTENEALSAEVGTLNTTIDALEDENAELTQDVEFYKTAAPPEEAFEIFGDCKYRFINGGWDWFVEKYGNKITTDSITASDYMFSGSHLKVIPFELNFKNLASTSISSLFMNCLYLEEVPKINNCNVGNMTSIFQSCRHLRYLPEDIENYFIWTNMDASTSGYSFSRQAQLKECRSLRSVPMAFLSHANPVSTYTISYLYNGFDSCSALDELVDLPLPYTATWTNNAFSNTFKGCNRLKNITFAMSDGQPCVMKWKGQTIDLSSATGWISSYNDVLNYNSGITEDKAVSNDEEYQALKNDPDWFAAGVRYSRYNHDSAVATINSLPDTSAYLATAGGTNTIKFRKEAGEYTDGGAINTLTEEEIAVATAKGWTVTFV